MKIEEYAALLRQSKASPGLQSPSAPFHLHFKRHLQEAVDVVESHPAVDESLSKSSNNYLGVHILNTGFGSYRPRETVERLIQGTVRRMLASDAMTAARDLDRVLVLGQKGKLPGYEITLVRGLKLSGRMDIEEGLFVIPCTGSKGEWFAGMPYPSGAFDPEGTGALVREFEWGSFLQSDPSASPYTPIFRCDVDPTRLCELLSVAIGKPLDTLYEYQRVPQWMQDFGYAGAGAYAVYDFPTLPRVMDEVVSREHLDNFRSLWLCYKAYEGDRSSIERAVEHLSRALARRGRLAIQDGILDTAIALETVYTAEIHTEIAHRLSSRAASFLSIDADEHTAIYGRVKRFYDVRSRLAHGSVPDREKLIAAYSDGFDIAHRTVTKILCVGTAPDWDRLVMSKL
ncbi:MAG: hypothetical protein F4Z82_17075 [Caldilineaceae bacterium SB0668_bin_21]|nr:hypothetical protein [Caldilineaceae bacterium SB0668_bin_21]